MEAQQQIQIQQCKLKDSCVFLRAVEQDDDKRKEKIYYVTAFLIEDRECKTLRPFVYKQTYYNEGIIIGDHVTLAEYQKDPSRWNLFPDLAKIREYLLENEGIFTLTSKSSIRGILSKQRLTKLDLSTYEREMKLISETKKSDYDLT